MDYDEFVADPMATAGAIYTHFGLPLTSAAAEAMRSLAAGRADRETALAHRYNLSDFGLTAEQVDERFAA